ncbi:MAG: hemerythrin domain-containing protein [Betaproteobacteria bacterium]
MAAERKETKSSATPATKNAPTRLKNALAKLKSDHDGVKKLFDQYEKGKDDMSAKDKAVMVAKICGELTVHAQIEEEIFYPAIREVQDEDLEELLDEAEVEHAGAKDLIAQLESAKPEDPLYDAKVTVLGEQIKHHAGEEEDEMFPKVRKVKELDLDELGAMLEQRSEALKAELKLK